MMQCNIDTDSNPITNSQHMETEMNIVERQTQLGRSLYEINTQAMTEAADLARKNVEQYFEVNRTFGERLPEVREISTFFEMQREYGETLWNNAREAMEAQSALFQSTMTETREAFETAFKAEEAPKPKAKKASKEAA